MNTEMKQRYSRLCEKDPDIPIYSQPWWMDTMCGEHGWDVFLVGDGMDIKASFVYRIVEDNGKKKICRALLTQNNGIYIRYPDNQGIVSKQKYEENIMNEILDYIESLGLSSYEQQHHFRLTNWLPFFWRYYKETVKYTYLIDNTSDMDMVRASYSSNARKLIRKAQSKVHVIEITDTEMFYRVNSLSFLRQNEIMPYSYEEFMKLYLACNKHDCVKLLGAVDEEDRIHAVAFIVWDNNYMYFLLNGTDPELKSFQGNYLLIDSCIEEAHKINKAFDFEGSVIRSVNHAFREFGGIPTPYFRIYKEYS